MIPSGWCRCWSACNYTSLYYCSLTLYCNDKFFFIKRNFERILITPKMHKHFFCFCKNARGTDILKPTLTSSQSHVPRQRKPFKNNVFSISTVSTQTLEPICERARVSGRHWCPAWYLTMGRALRGRSAWAWASHVLFRGPQGGSCHYLWFRVVASAALRGGGLGTSQGLWVTILGHRGGEVI